MKRSILFPTVLLSSLSLGVVACKEHYADVLYRSDSGAAVDSGVGEPLSPIPTCNGVLLDESELREQEILLGRLMTWTAGGVEKAQLQNAVEVARYFGLDSLLDKFDVATLGGEFLETLDIAQRAQLSNLLSAQLQPMTDVRQARNGLVAELWSPQSGGDIDTSQLTVLSAQLGRAEGQVALLSVAAFRPLLASLSSSQLDNLTKVISGEILPTTLGELSAEVQALIQGADGELMLALAANAYAWSQSSKLPPGESLRKIAPYFGYAYYDLKKASHDVDGAAIRSAIALDVYAGLNQKQRDLVCATLVDQESELTAYRDSRAYFLASAHGVPPGDEETLLAVHVSLGSTQGRIGLRQVQLFQALGETLNIQQIEQLKSLYVENNAAE